MDKQQHIKGGKAMKFEASKIITVPKEAREKAIRELALKIFQRKLDFVFKPDADPAHIDQLVESEPFQEYLKEAEKLYEKRLKALATNKTYPVIEVPADGKSGMMGGAYTLAFVYSKHKGNVVVKGYRREVEEYIKKNFTHYFVNYSLWYLGSHRDIWEFWKKGIGIHQPTKTTRRGRIKEKDRKFCVREYVDWNYDLSEEEREKRYQEVEERALYFRRMPKRWIPEFDNL